MITRKVWSRDLAVALLPPGAEAGHGSGLVWPRTPHYFSQEESGAEAPDAAASTRLPASGGLSLRPAAAPAPPELPLPAPREGGRGRLWRRRRPPAPASLGRNPRRHGGMPPPDHRDDGDCARVPGGPCLAPTCAHAGSSRSSPAPALWPAAWAWASRCPAARARGGGRERAAGGRPGSSSCGRQGRCRSPVLSAAKPRPTHCGRTSSVAPQGLLGVVV